MSLLQCYSISEAFSGHPIYNSSPITIDSLNWLYFSLYTFHNLNVAYVTVSLLCVPSQ